MRTFERRKPRPLAPGARAYLACVFVATAAAAVPVLWRLPQAHGWPTFLVFSAAAACAQLFPVVTPRDQVYHTAIVFSVAAAVTLRPELIALVGLVQHVPEWLKIRYRWYIQAFNICNWTLTLLAAAACVRLIEGGVGAAPQELSAALAGGVACVVVVALNHGLLAAMLHFGRGHSIHETGLFSVENLSTDLVLAGMGIVVSYVWSQDPWLLAFVIAPLLLIQRSLRLPRLEEETRVDPKTGLFNARHFSAALAEQLARASRSGRELSVIMADLDLLREVNNTYGHLAGDAVLAGVAEVFRREMRAADVPARFGGEEFAILLPETSPARAAAIADRIRRAVAAAPIRCETSQEPIHVTISMGVASFPGDATDAHELVHRADLAVYRAKLDGRDRVVAASGPQDAVPWPSSATSSTPVAALALGPAEA
jgi:diguanylate cyclase (GGDEF)-like protein